jgi:fluoride exporter
MCNRSGGRKMEKVFYVGLGGFIGASLRYLVSTYAAKLSVSQFPYGTLIVNVLGGILIGFIMGISLKSNYIAPNLKLFLTTGILGGLTTFSTFSYETIELFNNGRYFIGFTNMFLNLFLSLLGVVLGKYISSFI